MLLSLWGRKRPPEPPVEGALPVLDAGNLLHPHRSQLVAIRQLVGVPSAHWEAFYARIFEAYAGFVQQLPASEDHHHAGPGGMLTHGLEMVREALKLRRGQLLPTGAAAEELAARQDLWTYATATSALLHDIGKPVTDQRVNLYDRLGRNLGQWDPWAGPLSLNTGWYRVAFVRERRYRFQEHVPPLLVHFILPQRGLSWLASDPEVFSTWLAAISGDTDHAGILGELVHQADGLSVASDLVGAPTRMPLARRKPLSTQEDRQVTPEQATTHNNEPTDQSDDSVYIQGIDVGSVTERDASPSDADATSEDTDEDASSELRKTEASDDTDPGRCFLHWLKEGLASGTLANNTVNARVHAVPEGLLLVSPGIFKDFDRENWSLAQKRFQKLKLHRRTPQATNFWSYQVKGDRKQSHINGILIAEPERALGLQLPPPNSDLSRKE